MSNLTPEREKDFDALRAREHGSMCILVGILAGIQINSYMRKKGRTK